jgi:uncharacterized membrane protein
MTKNRLEAFSDGVIAIIITIMVLELKPPHSPDLWELFLRLPIFLSYLLSFVVVAIYWNNHHHLLHATSKINGAILWTNMHLLFWLSLIPFVTAWAGETGFHETPTAVYGFVLLMSGLSYNFLVRSIVKHHGVSSNIGKAIGSDIKGKISLIVYAIAVPVAYFKASLGFVLFVSVAVMWFIPDKRMEKVFKSV